MADIKAERETIYLGDIEINAYLLNNGEYCLAGRNVTDAIEEHHSTLARLFRVQSLKDLPHKDLSLTQVKADSGETFIPIALEDVIEYWFEMSCRGNAKARLLSKALMAETLESRLDNAFGIKRSQEERDEKLKARLVGKVTRRTWTDAVKAYLERHPEKSDSYYKFIYSMVSDKVNTLVFGMTAKQLRQQRGTTAVLLRDTHSAADLQLIERIEDYAMRLIDKEDLEPVTAICQAYEFYS